MLDAHRSQQGRAAMPGSMRGAVQQRRWLAAGIATCAAMLAQWPCHASAAERDASGATREHSIEVGGLERTYRLHVARQLDPEQPVPLVLVFHGGGGTPEQIERESRFSALADREGFVVAYPAGYRRSWNDGRGADAVAAQRDGVDDVAFVATLLDDVSAVRRIDPKRVYATGISNGAMFSHRLATRLASRVAAIAPVAGGLPQPLLASFDPQAPVSVLIVNGTLDPLVPYDGGEVRVFARSRGRVAGAQETAQRWSTHDGCSAGPVVEQVADNHAAQGCTTTRITYRNCAHATGVVLLRLNGGGHTWPGGSQYLPERLVGKVCRDVDATALIWDFFKHHPKP
jgi:polyhydroxybutyrate depolymerase